MECDNCDLFRFKSFIESMKDAIVVENENREISLVNQAFCDLFEIPASPENLRGADCSDSAEQVKHMFLNPDFFVERIAAILHAKKPVEHELVVMKDGRHFERDFLPVYKEGAFLGLVWIYKDLTSHYELEQELAAATRRATELSLQDPLTGIGNRRYLDIELEKCFRDVQGQRESLSVAVIDLDHFKNINDLYGHDVGDQVLKHFAGYLKASIRSTDVLARVGGEEFMIIMPHTSLNNAAARMNAIRASYRSLPVVKNNITFSAGVAGTKGGADMEPIFDFADQALYQAKKGGRNTVVIYTPPA